MKLYNNPGFFMLCLLLAGSSAICQKNCAYKGGHVDFLSRIDCGTDFEILQSVPLKSNYADVKSIKVVYDLSQDIIYYTESKKYRYHYDFCAEYLNAYSSLEDFNNTEYSNSRERKFAICNLNLYTASGIYTLEFFPDDEIRLTDVVKVFNKIKQTTSFGDKLKIADNSWHTRDWQQNKSLSFIGADILYAGQTYQAMSEGTACGHLRFFDSDETKNIHPDDIVVLSKLSNTLPLCAATITSVFQTPLCHINILSQNRNTPNCMVKNAFTDPGILKYKDQPVCMKVLRDTILITPASEKQAQDTRKRSQAKKPIALSCDNSFRQLAELKDLNIKTVNIAGGKASNMGELARIMVDKTRPLPIPQNVFAIPFYFYNQHISDHHIEPLIHALLNDKSIWDDHIKLSEKLKEIRDSIESSPLSEALLKMVIEKIGQNKDLNFRFRSSTNAEDVPGFNGAGLYDSKTGCLKSAQKPVDKAIKEVWASLWKERAFKERVFFNIDQSNLAMGILVNRAFGTEEANGVAITKNLYRDDYPAFTINVQKGEESIVQPDTDIRAEQFLVNFSPISNDRIHDLAVDYICHSSLQPDTPVLTKDEIRLLADYLLAIKTHYWIIYARKGISFNNLGMDVEFKLDHKTRKIVIKQARLY